MRAARQEGVHLPPDYGRDVKRFPSPRLKPSEDGVFRQPVICKKLFEGNGTGPREPMRAIAPHRAVDVAAERRSESPHRSYSATIDAGTRTFAHACPVQLFEQRRQMRRRQPHFAVGQPPPAERASLQPLGDQDHAAAVPEQQLQPVRPTTNIQHTDCGSPGSASAAHQARLHGVAESCLYIWRKQFAVIPRLRGKLRICRS